MANKQINELTEKSDVLVDDDLLLVWDSEEAGSEKTKKVAISNYVVALDTTGGVNYYISPSGNDTTGDGSSGSPWATMNKAYDFLRNKVFIGDGYIYINVADGTYTDHPALSLTLRDAARVSIIGNVSNPENVVFNFVSGAGYGFQTLFNGYLSIKGVTLNSQSGSVTGNAIRSAYSSSVILQNVRITGKWLYGVFCGNNAYVAAQGVYIDGPTTDGMRADHMGIIIISTNPLTINNCTSTALWANNSSGIRVLVTPSFSGNGYNYIPALNTIGSNNSMIYNT